MEDDSPARPPILLWLVVGLLVVVGALTVVKWVFSVLSGLILLAVVIGIVVLVVSFIRAGSRSRT
jgi:hypothetical protein